MKIFDFVILAACIGLASPAFAVNIVKTVTGEEIDCDEPANAENEACLEILDEGITNFVPLAAPVAGLLGLGALGGGGSSSTTTTSTTSTN